MPMIPKHLLSIASIFAGTLFNPQQVLAQNPVIYKLVDAAGRVTYANSPMKGATVLEIAPLVVLQSGSAVAATALARAPKLSLPQAYGQSSPATSATINGSETVGTETTVPGPPATVLAKSESNVVESPAIASRPEPLGSNALSTRQAAAMAQQRRSEVRRRIIEGELEAEDQLLREAKEQLTREQNKSPAMRALQAAVIANERESASRAVAQQDNAETKAFVERHFERVRDLQDQVAMHEANLAELRAQLPKDLGPRAQTPAPQAPTVVAKVSTRPPARQ